MGRLFAESRAALDNEEHLGPETRKTAQWAASMSRRTGDDHLCGNSDPPRQSALSSSRKRRFSTTAELCRMCAAPLWRAFQPEGERMSFCDQMAAAIDGARTLTRLDHLSRSIWQGLAGGGVGDDEAQALAERLHARRSVLRGEIRPVGIPVGRPSLFPPRRLQKAPKH